MSNWYSQSFAVVVARNAAAGVPFVVLEVRMHQHRAELWGLAELGHVVERDAILSDGPHTPVPRPDGRHVVAPDGPVRAPRVLGPDPYIGRKAVLWLVLSSAVDRGLDSAIDDLHLDASRIQTRPPVAVVMEPRRPVPDDPVLEGDVGQMRRLDTALESDVIPLGHAYWRSVSNDTPHRGRGARPSCGFRSP